MGGCFSLPPKTGRMGNEGEVDVNMNTLHKRWLQEPDFWQQKEEFVVTPEVLTLAQPFPQGWCKNIGIKQLEESDLERLQAANQGVSKARTTSPGDYRDVYEGKYVAVDVSIYMGKTSNCYDVLTIAAPVASWSLKPEPIALALTNMVQEVRGMFMKSFGKGEMPAVPVPKDWDQLKVWLRDMETNCEISYTFDSKLNEEVKDIHFLVFVPLHFPEKFIQVHLENTMNRERRRADSPLPCKDKLCDFLMSGDLGAFIVTLNVEDEPKADYVLENEGLRLTEKWRKLADYV